MQNKKQLFHYALVGFTISDPKISLKEEQKVWANMLSHISIFLGLVYTLFPSKLDIWLQKNLKSMSCTREWSKSPWFSTTGKGKKMLCFCHWPLTCWLPYDYWWCSWQNGKKCSCFWRRWIKRGKKQTERKKLPPQGINPSSFCLR